jgi:hypothetical protein
MKPRPLEMEFAGSGCRSHSRQLHGVLLAFVMELAIGDLALDNLRKSVPDAGRVASCPGMLSLGDIQRPVTKLADHRVGEGREACVARMIFPKRCHIRPPSDWMGAAFSSSL